MGKGTVIIGIVVILIVIAAAFVYFGNKKSDNINPPVGSSSGNEITISNFAFSPSTLDIKIGEKVSWINQDSAGHSVTSDSGKTLDSNILKKGESYSFTFTAAGEYDYHCSIHPGMKAKIIVS